MATELQVTKKAFYSDVHNRYEIEKIAIEDCKFLNFTEFLDETDVFNTPVVSRKTGTYKKSNWALLGYCCNSYRRIEDDEDHEVESEDSIEGIIESENKVEFQWEYTLFNGFFSDEVEVSKALKSDVKKSINEVVKFIEKTFSDDLIGDVCEAKDLQVELLKQYKINALERLDICIITDTVIDQENLDTRISIPNLNIECRIYYWDLKRWNDLKRSKSKRESINIDFQDKEFSIYNVDYLEKKTNANLSYYLAIFPGDLVADLYDLHNIRLLENNVRVFLSATRKANKGIRDTIKNEAYKFFSYNNGISATAESVVTDGNKVVNIMDFQIVNGGQTTATIHYSRKRDKYSLKDVYVAVKITALKKNEEYSRIVSKISQAANTQSTIAVSDFYANDKMLIDIEQFSIKNPVQNELDRNIYYFFERMKGQYYVSKISRGAEKQQKIWEECHPKSLIFNKIDIARWSNIMNGLPYVAAAGAEKQFKDFMDNKYIERKEISFGRFKTIVGLGLLFARIKKLCGTSNGKSFPSLTIDPNTGSHAPVAMSTAIYAMSYIHLITKGCLDYWSIYYYKYNLCSSLLSKERTDSDFDEILEIIIVSCWNQIASFGGSAAQEKTKNKACWDFVKANIFIPNDILKNLNSFMISDKERDERETLQSNNDDINYFKYLHEILAEQGLIISALYSIAQSQSKYLKEKAAISNFINKLDKTDSLLPTNRVYEIYRFYENLKDNGFIINNSYKGRINLTIDVNSIFEKVFNNKEYFLGGLHNRMTESEMEFENYSKLLEEVKEIIDKYYREYGLSIDDLDKLNNVLNIFKFN